MVSDCDQTYVHTMLLFFLNGRALADIVFWHDYLKKIAQLAKIMSKMKQSNNQPKLAPIYSI